MVKRLIIHLLRLGFSVELDDSKVQPTDYACGAVAALAAARMSEGDWISADLSLAVRPNIISNAVVSWLNLGLRAGDACPRLSGSQVANLYRFFMHVRIQSRGQNGRNGALFSVLTITDYRQAVEACGDGCLPHGRRWLVLYLLHHECVCAILRCPA